MRPLRRITSRAPMSEGSRRRGASERTPRGASVSLQAQRVRRTEEAFRSLPSRYLGADPGFDATFQMRLGDVGRTWEVRAQGERCHVRPSATREPDVVIGSDAGTWVGLREGRLSGLDAFAQRRLYARGDLDLALGFEGLFHLPGGRPPLLQVTDVEIPGATMRSLVAGDGPEPVVCLHGLGSNKASFFETVSALTPDHTVHAIDLPGFGGSSKPARGAYDAPYFARAVLGYMDAVGLQSAHLVGNSMGGRIALELALADPDRAITVSLLAPALAFRKRRELVPLVKLVRPELAAIPHPMRTAQRPRLLLGPVRPTGAPGPGGSRCRDRRVLPHLPVPLGPDRVLRRAAQHLPRRAARGQRAVDPAHHAAPSGPLRLGRQRSARAGRLLPPRGPGRPVGPPGDPAGMRPRAAGGARRPNQRADQGPHRRQRRGPLPPRGLAWSRRLTGSRPARGSRSRPRPRRPLAPPIARHHDVAPAPRLIG